MRNTRWVYRENPLKNNEDIQNLNLDKDILNLLYNRNIIEKEEIRNFLNVNIKNMADPFSLKDVDKAVNRLLQAKENNETVWVYGDYDVDGITSVSLCF